MLTVSKTTTVRIFNAIAKRTVFYDISEQTDMYVLLPHTPPCTWPSVMPSYNVMHHIRCILPCINKHNIIGNGQVE